MKDKITLGYILISIVLVALVAFYFAKLDVTKMNADITNGGKQALSAGEEYSKKLYSLAVSKLGTDDNVSKVKKGKKIVFTTGIAKPVKIEKAVVKQKVPIKKVSMKKTEFKKDLVISNKTKKEGTN